MEDLIPLARAAILAHERLFPGQETKEAKALERIGEPLIATGRFTRGATRLEFRDRPPLRSLLVSRAELPRAVEMLLRDSLAAGRLRAISLRASPRP